MNEGAVLFQGIDYVLLNKSNARQLRNGCINSSIAIFWTIMQLFERMSQIYDYGHADGSAMHCQVQSQAAKKHRSCNPTLVQIATSPMHVLPACIYVCVHREGHGQIQTKAVNTAYTAEGEE
jgi:hypothetical protein